MLRVVGALWAGLGKVTLETLNRSSTSQITMMALRSMSSKDSHPEIVGGDLKKSAKDHESHPWEQWMPPEDDARIMEVYRASQKCPKIQPEDIKLNFVKLSDS